MNTPFDPQATKQLAETIGLTAKYTKEDLKTITELLDKGADPNFQGQGEGLTFINLLLKEPYSTNLKEVITILLQAGTNLNTPTPTVYYYDDHYTMAPIPHALVTYTNSHTYWLTWLCKKQYMNPNMLDQYNATVFHWFALNNNTDITDWKYFIDMGCDYNYRATPELNFITMEKIKKRPIPKFINKTPREIYEEQQKQTTKTSP